MYSLPLRECNFLAYTLKIRSRSLTGRSVLHACLKVGKADIKLVPKLFSAGTDWHWPSLQAVLNCITCFHSFSGFDIWGSPEWSCAFSTSVQKVAGWVCLLCLLQSIQPYCVSISDKKMEEGAAKNKVLIGVHRNGKWWKKIRSHEGMLFSWNHFEKNISTMVPCVKV